MSTTVDSKVLEMRFDNKQFEAGVATSMSTLDKLKSKLNLTASAKGLENLGTAAKKCDMSGLGAGVDALQAKFSALQVIGVTALANLTNSAVNAGKRMVKALTIEPVMTGFNEYETKINAVQTILSNTANKGTKMADVTRVLDELNTYADKTIYNFAEMTRNIGTFTAAGVGLEDSAAAIQGIANLAAMSGSNSQQAATAMYQLSQALAAGTVKLMDWNSVVNAGMGGQKFQDALKQTAREMGISVDAIIKKHGSFRESLTEGWITADVLNTTLKKLTVEGATDYANAMVKSGKYTKEQAKTLIEEAQAAEDAATKVKTFTQLWDTTKETVQSGWAKTWELIIGDFEQAKNLLTPFSDFLNGIIDGMSDARNALLESALGMGFEKLHTSVNKALAPIKKMSKGAKEITEKVDNVTSSLGSLGEIVDDVIIGKFGNGQERFDKLTKAGENYYKIQNKVNETLGDSFRYSKEQIDAQDKLLKSQNKTNESQEKTAKSTSKTKEETTKLTKAQKNQLKSLVKMSEEQARTNGYTDEQIKALKDLKETADKLGMPLDEFIDKMDEINGRWLLINSFKNIGTALSKVFSSIGKGFREVFDPIKPEQLFNAIAALHKFTAQLIISDETADKVARTFRGLFAAIDIVGRIAGSGLRLALTILSSVLRAFGVTTLDVTASIGDLIYKFDEWLKEHDVITKFIEKIADKIPPVIDKIKEFIANLNFKENAGENFKKIAEGLESIWTVVHGKFTLGLNSALKLLKSIFELFGTSLGDVIGKIAELVSKFASWINENTLIVGSIQKVANIIYLIIEGITKLAKAFVGFEPVQKMIENIKKAFSKLGDIFDFDFDGSGLDALYNFIENFFTNTEKWIKGLENSKFFKAGLNIVEGLANGIATGIGKAIEAIKNVGQAIIDAFCGLLGIHSPSRVFIMLGGYIIAGLLIGLKHALPEVYDVFNTLFSKLLNSVKEFDFKMNDLFVAGTVVAMLLLMKKALDIANKLVSPIDAIKGAFNKLGGVFVSLDKYIKAKALETRANAILTFAKAIAILAASIFLLSRIEVGDLVNATAALAALVGLMTILMVVATKADGLAGFKFGKLSVLMVSLGLSLTLLAFAMKKLADLDPKGSTRALKQLVTLIAAMTLVVGVYGKFVQSDASGNMSKAGSMLIKMSIAIGLLALVIKLINTMSWKEIGKGAAVITGAILLVSAFSLLGNIPNANVSKAGSMLLKMAVAIGILIMVVKLINTMTWGEIGKGAAVIAGIMVLFGALTAVSFFAGKYAARAGVMFMLMASAIGILALTIKLIATIPDNDISRSTQVIINIMTMFNSVMILSNFIGKNAAKAGAMFLMMSVAIGMLAISIKFIAGISEEDINKGMNVIMSIEILFMSIMILSSFVGENADKAGTMMLKMSAAILILAGAIALLSILDPADVVRGTACISALLVMFALLTYVTQYAADSFKTMTVLAVTIGLLAGSLAALSFLDPNKLITATACMSVVIGMFALLVKASDMITTSMGALIVLTAAIGMIGGILYLLAQLPMESALGAATALSTLLVAMSVALMILNNVQTVTPMALLALGAMVAAMGLIAVVLGLMQTCNIQPSLETALALSTLLLAMSGALLILAGVGAVAPYALAGVGTLLLAVAAIGAFITGVGALFEKLSGLEGFLDTGIEILSKIGYGIGKFVGSIAGGLLDGVTSGLPGVGSNLGLFMTNAKPFFDGLKSVDPSMAESAKSLAVAILAITGAGILDAISKWLTGGTNMDTFGAQLVSLGKGMKAYAAEVAGIDAGAISASANAAKALVQVAKSLPREGGLWQSIAGSQDIASFGSKLKAFGKGMKDYASEVAGIDSSAISASASAAQGLAQVAKSLPKEGGWLETIVGSQDISSFGAKLKAFGKGMKSYATEVAGIDTGAITSSVSAAKGLVAVAKSLPKDGGWLQNIVGGKDIKSFGSKLKSFGSAIKGYSTEVAGTNTAAISSSVSAAKLMVGAIKSTSGLDTSGVKKFVAAVDKLADTDMDAVASAFSGAASTAKMVSAGVRMVKSVGSGIKSSAGSVKSAAKSTAASIASSFSSQTAVMNKAGSSLVSALAKGMTSKKGSVLSAGRSLANSAKSGVTSNSSGMISAGQNLGSGLVLGINAKKTAAYNAGFALGQAAVQGEKDGQKSNSPSKATIQAGGWLGEGLVIGIKRMGSAVYNAGHDMGERATASISSALTRVGAIVDSDMDIQPTIAPVMDLSNVEAGVGAIGGMFNKTMTIGANANINAIGSMMNRRNQNATNDDVVSAIDKLRKDLGNIGGDTYNLSGITYDDGSNVADAIQTLVRAAVVERRK